MTMRNEHLMTDNFVSAVAMHDPCKIHEDCLAMTLNSFCREDRKMCSCEVSHVLSYISHCIGDVYLSKLLKLTYNVILVYHTYSGKGAATCAQ